MAASTPAWPTPPSEDVIAQATILMFSISLGMGQVLVPLVATAEGYSLSAVGFLVAVSAVTQIIARAGMGPLMDRFSTKSFILASVILLGLSAVLLGFSDALWAFVVSQLLQGAARAYFFTGAQTHVVRGSRPAVSAMSLMNITNGIGLLVGPLVAGFVGDISLQAALYVAGALAGVGAVTGIFLIRYEPFSKPAADPGRKTVPVWRRPGVVTAGWMGATAGAWRAILNSYLPVLVTAAGHSIPMAGAMTTLANLAALGGATVARVIKRMGVRASTVLATALLIVGTALFALLVDDLWISGLFLALSGLGGGILQTLGPALAAEAVTPEERGRSIASVGTYRAISLLVTPMGIGALVLVLPTAGLATAVVAVLVGLPGLLMKGPDRET